MHMDAQGGYQFFSILQKKNQKTISKTKNYFGNYLARTKLEQKLSQAIQLLAVLLFNL